VPGLVHMLNFLSLILSINNLLILSNIVIIGLSLADSMNELNNSLKLLHSMSLFDSTEKNALHQCLGLPAFATIQP
ncbi:hypothetical protein, partial [Mycobacterium tuberculosis]